MTASPGALTAQGMPADTTAAHAAHVPPGAPTPGDLTMMARGPLGISQSREGSGTSWLPDETPMHALHRPRGAWELMLHGNAFVQYIDQGSDRGQTQFGSINWLMGMARRAWLGGSLGLRAMMSAEPFTIPGCGYPILLATGEQCDGQPIHDAQHPHDLFMELAGLYQRSLGSGIALELYGGPAGEPALGPVAFPHRTSALASPLAPIAHHWLDATHITFGVATAGLYGRRWKLEGSLFNGREPDENRTDLDLAPLDSYAGRLWILPTDRWALQLSAGQLNEAEPPHEAGDGRVDVTRLTASATYHGPLARGGSWATTAAFGRNVEDDLGTTALLVESSLSFAGSHLLFGRVEWVEKPGEDLVLEDAPTALTSEITPLLLDESRVYRVGTLAVGYTRQFDAYHGWLPGVGARASVNFVPEALQPVYGESSPVGLTVFVSLRPRAMDMGTEMGMADAAPAAGHEHGAAAQPAVPGAQAAMPGMEHAGMPMPSQPRMDSTAPHHEMAGDSTGGMMSAEHVRMMRAMHERMMDDPVIRERIATDPTLRRMMDEMNAATGGAHGVEAMGAAETSAEARALEFIVQLLSKPEVEARIHADPALHRLWSDPRVQRRLAELKAGRPGGGR